VLLISVTSSVYGQDNSKPKFRIQIQAFGLEDTVKSKILANRLTEELKMSLYIIQEDEWNKIRIGDFIDYDDAKEKLDAINPDYPNAWIVETEEDNVIYTSGELEYSNGEMSGNGNGEKKDSATYLVNNNKVGSNLLKSDFFKSKIFIYAGGFGIIILSIFLFFIRRNTIAEKKRISKEERENIKIWDNLFKED